MNKEVLGSRVFLTSFFVAVIHKPLVHSYASIYCIFAKKKGEERRGEERRGEERRGEGEGDKDQRAETSNRVIRYTAM